MINTKEVKKRIGSVKNTKKITKAMEMIAAVKMRKAVNSAQQTRSYSQLAQQILSDLGGSDVKHPLTGAIKNEDGERTAADKRFLIISITSNRGLCGSYNAKVLKKSQELVDNLKEEAGVEVDIIAIGNKAALFARRNGLNLNSFYDKLHENPKFEEITPIARTIKDEFLKGRYKSVYVIYTNYISGMNQETEVKKLLPISQKIIREFNKSAAQEEENFEDKKIKKFDIGKDFKFEPGKRRVLDFVLPMLIEIQLFQAILESAASEHSSRMIAMKNATDAASEMIDDLTLEFNKARQAAITQEISEIVSGANAL